jgi:hypothetical protein
MFMPQLPANDGGFRFVISGRAQGASPESRGKFRAWLWIPGPGFAPSRNDGKIGGEIERFQDAKQSRPPHGLIEKFYQ